MPIEVIKSACTYAITGKNGEIWYGENIWSFFKIEQMGSLHLELLDFVCTFWSWLDKAAMEQAPNINSG
jgi:hypothetical protein